MNEHLIDLANNSGFIVNGEPNYNAISNASQDEITDFCYQFKDITSFEHWGFQPSIYTHTASCTLGGGEWPCQTGSCRIRKLKELLQFSGLYSDRVYINNFFTDFLGYQTQNIERYRYNFTNSIEVLSFLLPSLEIGSIIPVTFDPEVPFNIAKRTFMKTSKDMDKTISMFLERFYDEIQYKFGTHKNWYTINAVGPEELIPHGHKNIAISKEEALSICDKLSIAKNDLKNLYDYESELSKSEARSINAAYHFFDQLFKSVAFEIGGSQLIGSSYLTESEIELDFINSIISDPLIQRRTTLMQKYLTCLVPFAESLNPNELLKLRKGEEESFILFRNALTKAVEEYKIHGTTFSERDAQAVYADIIEPELARLNAKIRKANRLLLKGSIRSIVGWTGAISVGLYTGILTQDPLKGTAVFAAAKLGAEGISHFLEKSDSEEEVRDNNWYFLWKVKEKLSE